MLLDANILVYLIQPNSPFHQQTLEALVRLRHRNEPLHIVRQTLIEFWVAITRPESNNGLGLSAAQAAIETQRVKTFFTLLPELPTLVAWEQLVISMEITGKATHDAHLVAAMQVNGISKVLTVNDRHFRRFPGIQVLHPAEVLSSW